eukprot:TRINITY_DN1143_c0_g2_i1.p1 TRINITY_DN1143_c0_g2~~TRINITY_DN1143_c0_g2_i1.p1  ORF type:complete len:536 (+),score=189.85 TRINITY_DN1143_c0_g2_i1:72-1679(+)
MKQFTAEEVATHNKADDCWLIIDGKVYDVTPFLNEHPGGKKVVLMLAGKDATAKFSALHKPDVLAKYGSKLLVGQLASGPAAGESANSSAPAVSRSATGAGRQPGFAPPADTLFGELVPMSDPDWYQGHRSPYFKESHRRLRRAMREFVQREIEPFCFEWDEAKQLPSELRRKCFAAGWLAGFCGAPWPEEYAGGRVIGDVPAAEFDMFHELILIDELARCGSGGVLWGIVSGLSIGLPPILHFGSPEMKRRIAPACLSGEKVICLAITEPYAGSDVAGLRCEARKTADGRHYIVNGEKKWITNAVFADYFTVAVRTGGAGMGGISLLLIERTMPGVTTRQMHCTGVWSSGTTYITFEDVKVPVENLIGKENVGFRYIMHNFNHERWGIVVQASRFARVCYDEAFRYAHKRKTFGQRLIDNPLIRNKLGLMAAKIEATHSWLESVTYNMTQMSHEEQALRLSGPIALLKAQSTQTFEFCAREAAQIFGGLSYTRGGQGEKVERLNREVRAYAIPGGSEEIMLDLGIRQAMRHAKL